MNLVRWIRSLPTATTLMALIAGHGTSQSRAPQSHDHSRDARFAATPAASLVRTMVALGGGMRHDLPLCERERGLRPDERAALYEIEVQRRIADCDRACRDLLPQLERIGAKIAFQTPMFHACVIDCPADQVKALRVLPGVLGVWRDTIAPSHRRAARGTSDPSGTGIEHHRAQIAHARGFTGRGTANVWAPVVAVLDGWLEGKFGSATRYHVALQDRSGTTPRDAVLAQLDWANPKTQAATRPLNSQTANVFNVYHGPGVAGILAGKAVSGPNLYPFTDGHAPGADLVSMNILKRFDPRFIVCSSTTDPAGYWAFQSQVLAGLNKIAQKRFDYTGTTVPTRPILFANLSYGGPPNPTHVVADAMRRLATDHDILVVTSAGNSGTVAYESYYNLNGLAVGAVEAWRAPTTATTRVRTVPAWSTVGPLTPASTANWCAAAGDAAADWPVPNGFERDFPDVAAVGSIQRLLVQDDETRSDLRDGTSLAAPHVTAAALLHGAGADGLATSAPFTILETRAAILASTENTNPDGAGDNSSGAGFLRTDRLTYASGLHDMNVTTTIRGTIAGNPPIQANDVYAASSFNVVQGERYSVAIAWFADQSTVNATAPNWLDLDLRVTLPGGSTTTVGTINRTWERFEFSAPASGTATVDVVARRVSASQSLTVATATCRVGSSSQAMTELFPTDSTPPCTVDTAAVAAAPFYSRMIAGPTLTTMDQPVRTSKPRWIALRFDGAGGRTASNGCPLGWFFGNSASPEAVTRIELETASPCARVVPCRLVSSSTNALRAPFQESPNNFWDGWMRIPAGRGVAVAEFYAKATAINERPRWFCVEMTPDVRFFDLRYIGSGFCMNQPQNNSGGAWSQTDDPAGMLGWQQSRFEMFYALRAYSVPSSGDFAPAFPVLDAPQPPLLGHPTIDLLLTQNMQQNQHPGGSIYMLMDTQSGETTGIQGIDPVANAGCSSLLKASTQLFVLPAAFAQSGGTGTRVNPLFGNAARIAVPIPSADPGLLGLTLYFQALVPVGTTLGLRPSSTAAVSFGLD